MRALFFDGMVIVATLCLLEIIVLFLTRLRRGVRKLWRGE